MRDVVLIGGGHAHVHVMAAFGRRPEPGVRVTLVTRDLLTPYSGMLPGLVAGFYNHDEAHIDLPRLAASTGVGLVHAAATGLDREARLVLLADRPSLGYDLVSLDVGITPDLSGIEGAARHAIAVKPISHCIEKIGRLVDDTVRPNGPRRIAVVGGGAGGVELLLSLRTRLRRDMQGAGRDPDALRFALITSGEILATHNARVRSAFRRVFAEDRIDLHEHRRVKAIDERCIHIDEGDAIAADAVLVTTAAAAPEWFDQTGLALEKGFLAVGPTLQSMNDRRVFAAGDCAALVETPREKAGVYAVRAGPPLARNLRAVARGEEPRPWRPQSTHLALISTGERHAIGSRGALKLEGHWLWWLKDRIDRRWMRRYQRS